MKEENRPVAAVALFLAYLVAILLISYWGGTEPTATVSWPLALVMLATFAALGDTSRGALPWRRAMLHCAIAVLFFGGLWFISKISPNSTLDAFVWPLAAIVGVLIVTLNIERIGAAFRHTRIIVRRVAIGGVEVELDRAVVDRVERELSSSIRNLFDSIDREYRRQVRIRRVELLLGQVYRELPTAIFPTDLTKQAGLQGDASHRAAVHISDVVFPEFMYQLTDYASSQLGSGAGRRFSKRRGIVGLSWRLKQSLGQGNVFSGHTDPIRALQERWGMFESETAPAQERPSCLTVILKSQDGRTVGLLYVDSKHTNAFGDDAEAASAATTLENNATIQELGRAIGAVDLIMGELALNFDLAKLAV